MKHKRIIMFAGAFIATGFILSAGTAFPPDQNAFRINLRSRSVSPKPGIAAQLTRALASDDSRPVHGIVQFNRALTLDEHQFLNESGVRLLGSLGNNSYTVSLRRRLRLDQGRLGGLVRWAGTLQPADKIDRALAQGEIFDWAFVDDGKQMVKVLVQFFADVDRKDVIDDLGRLDLRGQRYGADNSWALQVRRDQIDQIAGLLSVKLVQQGPVPFLPLNESGRWATNTNEAQQANWTNPQPSYGNVSGLGVNVGICDSGIDQDNNDFSQITTGGAPGASRVYNQRPAAGVHGTHVASIAGGNGINSFAIGLPGFILRGHAPQSGLGDYPSFGSNAQSYHDAIVNDGTDVTNHSYVQSMSVYNLTASSLDIIIRGDGTDNNGDPIPARPQVWAAGNNGASAQYGNEEGYYAIFTSAKNSISVGSVDAMDLRLSRFTSLGPSFDGRIKPDLVAPGSYDSIANRGIQAALSGTQGYTSMSGTSMAAPVVTGIIALMMEQYQTTYGFPADTLLRPATYKAMLVHTARDQVKTAAHPDREFNNPDTGSVVLYHAGPDFATGFGLVDAEAARDIVTRSRQWRQSSIGYSGQLHTYCIDVPEGAAQFKVVIAWDDEPGDTSSAETTPKLVNDLDLELRAPDGTIFQPWTLDPLPLTANPGDGALDPITPGDVDPAYRGADRRNNVEMASVNLPQPGRWRARIRAYSLPNGNAQPYSLVSSHPIVPICFHLPPKLCDLFPWICDPIFDFPFKIIDREWYVDPRVPVPIDEICKYVLDCPGCDGPGWAYCPGWRLNIRNLPEVATVIIFDQYGEIVVEDRSRRTMRTIQIERTTPGDQFYVMFADPKGAPFAKPLRLKFELSSIETPANLPIQKPDVRPPEAKDGFQIQLSNRRFTPKPGIDPALARASRKDQQHALHGVVQLYHTPTSIERAALIQSGITLTQYLNGTTYYGTFTEGFRPDTPPELIRWAGPLIVQDKVQSALLEDKPEPWALTNRGDLKLMVAFHPDVDKTVAARVLAKYTDEFNLHGPSGQWAIELPLKRVKVLAGEEPVRWIEQGPLPFMPLGRAGG